MKSALKLKEMKNRNKKELVEVVATAEAEAEVLIMIEDKAKTVEMKPNNNKSHVVMIRRRRKGGLNRTRIPMFTSSTMLHVHNMTGRSRSMKIRKFLTLLLKRIRRRSQITKSMMIRCNY